MILKGWRPPTLNHCVLSILTTIRNFHSRMERQLTAHTPSTPVINEGPFFSLIYMPGWSEKIQKIFKKYNVCTALSSTGNISFLFNNY